MAQTKERAKYGAAASASLKGKLPNPFPRVIGPNAMKYLKEVVDSGFLLDMATRFEKAFAEALGVKHVIASPGCTPALQILASAFGFEPGDEIIVSPITDYGTVAGLIRENYIPVFADTAPGTVNISAATIEPCITDRTRAILCVDMTGLFCDMDPINALAKKHGLVVYDDCCQSVFGEYKGRLAGTLAQASAFSFDPEKTMGSDTGGCIATNDDDLAERCRLIGQSRGAEMREHYGRAHVLPGYAFRMPHCTAAICLAQLEIIRDSVAHIDRMVRLLSGLVNEIPGVQALPIPDYQDVYSCWMFGITIDPEQFKCSTEELGDQLSQGGIPGASQSRYYLMPTACTFLDENARAKKYPYSIPPASRGYRYGPDTCPTGYDFLERFIRWSTFCDKYTEKDCELAASIIRQVADRNRR
jgi:dTDP-4-amino-4,6-dideoxygalactose transaminase